MGLTEYQQKRDFGTTAEPKGRRARKGGNSFVIQKHAARRLHYDLRLEMDGVLRSWAVTRGPSLVAGEKRLAVHVEDHPLDYGDFEGTIPKGQYGAGTVLVWDRGTWEAIGNAAKGYAKGHLEFELSGEKLSGRWHLVRMQGKAAEKRENWLLIKADDSFARPDDAPDILTEQPSSVKTGRGLDAVAAGADPVAATPKPKRRKVAPKAADLGDDAGGDSPLDPAQVKGATARALPEFAKPMLATLAPSPPTGARWLHEIKFDGYRLQARIEDKTVRLLTRSGLDWTQRFEGPLTRDLLALPLTDALIDGELVVETASGASDFSALQSDLSEGRADRFRYYAFDLLHLDGSDLHAVPLLQRKAMLEQVLAESGKTLHYSTHFDEGGALVLRHACRLSLEGIISKRVDSRYLSGRSKSWIKSKCSARQEFVIGGYTPSSTSRQAIGSLVLGVYEGDALHHVGRVGTGFSTKVAEELYARLKAIGGTESPFATPLTGPQKAGLEYVRPELVAEVEFRAWTADGHLRHASFRGLREDKPAPENLRESAAGKAAGKAAAKPAAPLRPAIKLTHPDRVYWPDAGVTKEGLADYYTEVWPRMAPFVVGRPLALLRCPEGISGPTFFQKHAWRGISDKIDQVKDPKSASSSAISISSLEGLIALVQSAVLEIHPWGAKLDDWERPDTIVMDLDPGENVSWPEVIAAAEEVRERLSQAGLTAFVKTSGGKGLHVVAPLKPHARWPEVKAFSRSFATAMAADAPDRYVATLSKAKRRGKILIDYLRNQRGATAVAAYSTRARPGAAVSTPLDWSELSADIGPDQFTVQNLSSRLATLRSDPWEGYHDAAVPLRTKAQKK